MESQFKKTGFTLMELVVVVGIFTLFIGAGFSLLSSSRLSTDINEARISAAESARQAMDRIAKELQLSRASKVCISNSLSFPPAETSPGIVIIFQIPVGSYAAELDLDADGDIRWGCAANEGHYITYSAMANSQLLRTTYTDAAGSNPSDEIIAQNISSMSFNRGTIGSEDLIDIEIVGQGETSSGRIVTQTLHSNVKLRN